MMRRCLAALLGSSLALLGCEPTLVEPRFAELSGVYDTLRVGELLFITSAGTSELRVVDTLVRSEELTAPVYLRAPNPLEVLSIPVVSRPVELVSDLRYGQDGRELPGRYVFVRGTGSSQITVVGAEQTEALGTVEAPQVGTDRTARPVTALAAAGPGEGDDDGESALYFATQDADAAAHIYRVTLPAPSQLAGLSAEARRTALQAQELVASDGATALRLPGRVVTALLVLPQQRGAPSVKLAVATRPTAGAVTDTRPPTFVLDLSADSKGLQSTNQPEVALAFRKPVRMLRSHPSVQSARGDKKALGAGARILGVQDESTCAAELDCGGVEAVNGFSFDPAVPATDVPGAIALDGTHNPMLPIRVDNALVQGLTFAASAVPRVTGSEVAIEPAGAFTASNGGIFLFDLVDLRHVLDFAPAPSVRLPTLVYYSPSQQAFLRTGTAYAQVGAKLQEAKLKHGLARLEALQLEFQAAVPGLSGLPLSSTGQGFQLSPELAKRVLAGDTARLGPSPTCSAEVTVTAVALDTGAVSTAQSIPSGCSLLTEVRSGGDKPWVLSGTVSGYLARAQQGDHVVSEQGIPFHHPDGFVEGQTPLIEFDFPTLTDFTPEPGGYFRFDVNPGFIPYRFVAPMSTIFGVPQNLFMPGGLASSPFQESEPQGNRGPFLYVAYPSGDSVMRVNPLRANPGGEAGDYVGFF